jgi:hypothetical protein
MRTRGTLPVPPTLPVCLCTGVLSGCWRHPDTRGQCLNLFGSSGRDTAGLFPAVRACQTAARPAWTKACASSSRARAGLEPDHGLRSRAPSTALHRAGFPIEIECLRATVRDQRRGLPDVWFHLLPATTFSKKVSCGRRPSFPCPNRTGAPVHKPGNHQIGKIAPLTDEAMQRRPRRAPAAGPEPAPVALGRAARVLQYACGVERSEDQPPDTRLGPRGTVSARSKSQQAPTRWARPRTPPSWDAVLGSTQPPGELHPSRGSPSLSTAVAGSGSPTSTVTWLVARSCGATRCTEFRCGNRIRTGDLWVMSPTRCRAALSR